MKKAILILSIAFLGLSAAEAKTSKVPTSKTTNEAPTPSASEVKTQALLYWFDANTGQYLGHTTASGCDNSNSTPCAKGYMSVDNPSQPEEPQDPDQQPEIATGVRP